MYFENRVNIITPVPTLEETAKQIITRSFKGNGVQFNNFIFVDDSTPYGIGIYEVAIVDQEQQQLIESITVEWVKSFTTLLAIFQAAIKIHNNYKDVKVPLCIDDLNNNKITLECGCCGRTFKDLYSNQKKYDQDSGFGICPNCQRWYL